MANIKRIVDTKFWEDEKVIDNYSVEDKYFLLYLMTNPHTKQVGIYKLPKKIISFETGYTKEVVEVLLQRFEDNYKNISYSKNTQEVAVLNSLKYSIVKGGKPVEDCLKKELRSIEDTQLIISTYNHLINHWELSERPFDETVKSLFELELQKRKVAKEKINDNENENENDNERIVNESYHESSNPPPPPIDYERIQNLFNDKCISLPPIAKITDKRKQSILARVREHGVESIDTVIDNASKSKFMAGDNDRNWVATFDWIIKPSNYIKVLEGNYLDRGGNKNGADTKDDQYDLEKHGIGFSM